MTSQLKPFDKVVVKRADSPWTIGFFSYVTIIDKQKVFVCGSDAYTQCLKYNAQTEKLIGTYSGAESLTSTIPLIEFSDPWKFPVGSEVLTRSTTNSWWVKRIYGGAGRSKNTFEASGINVHYCIPFIGNEHAEGKITSGESGKWPDNVEWMLPEQKRHEEIMANMPSYCEHLFPEFPQGTPSCERDCASVEMSQDVLTCKSIFLDIIENTEGPLRSLRIVLGKTTK